MPTPKEGYELKDGRSVPGASTIADYFKDRAGVDNLISWGHSMGKKGLSWRGQRDVAGNIGTIVHKMVEDHIRGSPVVTHGISDANDIAAAWRAFSAFREWSAGLGVKYLDIEPTLVSEANEYGGTPDAIGRVDVLGQAVGDVTLFDWKTGAGIYKSALRQVAAYKELWNENYPATSITNGAYIVRFDKKSGVFEWHHVSNAELDVAFESFLGFYEEWRRDRALEIILERSKSRA